MTTNDKEVTDKVTVLLYSQTSICVFLTLLIVMSGDWSGFMLFCNAFMGFLTYIVLIVFSSVFFD